MQLDPRKKKTYKLSNRPKEMYSLAWLDISPKHE